MWRCWRVTDLFFFEDRPHCRLHYRETFAQRSGDLRIEKHHAALGMIANMLCGPQKPTSLTPMMYGITFFIPHKFCLRKIFVAGDNLGFQEV